MYPHNLTVLNSSLQHTSHPFKNLITNLSVIDPVNNYIASDWSNNKRPKRPNRSVQRTRQRCEPEVVIEKLMQCHAQPLSWVQLESHLAKLMSGICSPCECTEVCLQLVRTGRGALCLLPGFIRLGPSGSGSLGAPWKSHGLGAEHHLTTVSGIAKTFFAENGFMS